MKKLAFTLSIVSGAVAFFSHHAEASTQYTVQPGDSLWSIANKYNMPVDELKRNNHLVYQVRLLLLILFNLVIHFLVSLINMELQLLT